MSGFEDLPPDEQAELEQRAHAYLNPEQQNQVLYNKIVGLLNRLMAEDREQGTHRVGRIEADNNFAVFATGRWFGVPHPGYSPLDYYASFGHTYKDGIDSAYVTIIRESPGQPESRRESGTSAVRNYTPESLRRFNVDSAEIQFDACSWIDGMYVFDETPRQKHAAALRRQLEGE